jgi:hypothetical protein
MSSVAIQRFSVVIAALSTSVSRMSGPKSAAM